MFSHRFCHHHCKHPRFCVGTFAFAAGITAFISALALGLGATYWGWSNAYVNVLSTVYIGYAPTVVGSFKGALWAFVHGFILGAIFSSIYNLICNKCSRHAQKVCMEHGVECGVCGSRMEKTVEKTEIPPGTSGTGVL